MAHEKKCDHRSVRFHSGDYHIGCTECGAVWTITDREKHNPDFASTTRSGIDRLAPPYDDGK
jgi:uncharacterized Zn finger protein